MMQLGVEAHNRGRLADAAALYRIVLSRMPAHYDALRLLGMIAASQGHAEQAVALLGKAAALRPNDADAHWHLGNGLFAAQCYEDAVARYDQAIALRPDHAPAHVNRGAALEKCHRLDDALACYDRAIACVPDNDLAHYNRGFVLEKLRRFDEAVTSYDRAIALNPSNANAFFNRGVALYALDRCEDAIESYQQAIALKPDFVEALSNCGVALCRYNRFHDAMARFDQAIAIDPAFAEALASKGTACLALGDFTAGWQLLEWRKKLDQSRGARVFPFPECLDAQAMANKRVLIHWEQGLGDTIQFCRYVPMVADRAAEVAFAVPAPLRSLLSQAMPGVRVIADTEITDDFDLHCQLMSLPLAFATMLPTIPAKTPYLTACRDKSAAFAQRLGRHDRPRVGLVWNGGFRPEMPALWAVNRRRNIAFSDIANLNVPGIDFFSLQKGEPAESALVTEKPRFWPSDNFHDLTADLHDFSDTAALIDTLDLVISVDTATAHLAGAMGKPVWILNRFDACWRWLIDRTNSPWYPTARLFRQAEPGAWQVVLREVRGELLGYFADRLS